MQLSLYLLRKSRGYTQEYMADYLNIDINSYRNKEKGITEFKMGEMFQLSELFNLQMEQIFLPRNLGDTEILERLVRE